MAYYIMCSTQDSSLFLQVKNAVTGASIHYTEDEIMALYRPGQDVSLKVYKDRDNATGEFIGKKFAPPVFEVSFKDNTIPKQSDIVDEYGNTQSFLSAEGHSIQHVISAIHAGIIYNLTAVFESRNLFFNQLGLLTLRVDPGNKDQQNPAIQLFIEQTSALQGKIPYSELAAVYIATNEFLDNPSLINNKKYQAIAKTKQGAPSTSLQVLGACMIGLAATIITLNAGLFLGASLALVGVGLFSAGMQERGLYRHMKKLSIDEKLVEDHRNSSSTANSIGFSSLV